MDANHKSEHERIEALEKQIAILNDGGALVKRVDTLEGDLSSVLRSVGVVQSTLERDLDKGKTDCIVQDVGPILPDTNMTATIGVTALQNILYDVGDAVVAAVQSRRPVQIDGTGDWTPPPNDPDWETIPLDDSGKPDWPDDRWDPWNPDVPESGKVITEDCSNFRIFCKGVVYEIPYDDLCPDAPATSESRPDRDERAAVCTNRTERQVILNSKNMYIRITEACFTQVTCVVSYTIRERTWHYRSAVPHWHTRGEWTERQETLRRSSSFSCP